jgi:hypothetical protein
MLEQAMPQARSSTTKRTGYDCTVYRTVLIVNTVDVTLQVMQPFQYC